MAMQRFNVQFAAVNSADHLSSFKRDSFLDFSFISRGLLKFFEKCSELTVPMILREMNGQPGHKTQNFASCKLMKFRFLFNVSQSNDMRNCN